ncbi:BNR repeat-like domain-containing protein [Paenibacillus sp. UNCCL117]|uniref:sialidase family protein n=1 Tax=unclassified Paenibacillus TaxID=185978 RepID=UPI00088F7EF1|nr:MULTISPECIES: exo-alpha-sialidase [unclassified Paenibacillus]SDD24445.1 BNR repeat-like domain-containing protein [Paenibacillus sp. cl123]SFW41484.1 BNR repeat-like domain-containing protein [Paenibacillus sp. UNCCL117]
MARMKRMWSKAGKLQFFLCTVLIMAMIAPEAWAAGGVPDKGAPSKAGSVSGASALEAVVGYAEDDVNPEWGPLGRFGYDERLELDYEGRSVGVDLGMVRSFNRIEIVSSGGANRVEKTDLSLYIGTDNYEYEKVNDWDFVKIGNRIVLYNLSETARYVKVHNHFDDRVGSFYHNRFQDMIGVYSLPAGSWTGSGGGGWLYRKPIAITNPGSETIFDRPVYLDKQQLGIEALIQSGKLQADMRDVRFAAGDGRELHFYADDDGFYVRIPEMPASASMTIDMYYGNPDALFRGGSPEALQIEYGNKTLIEHTADLTAGEQEFGGDLKPLRLNDGTLVLMAGSDGQGILAKYSYDGGKSWTNPESFVDSVVPQGSSLYEFPGGAYVDPATDEVYLFFSVHHYFGVWEGNNSCLSADACRNDLYMVKSTGYDGKKPVFGVPQQITGLQTASGAAIHYSLTYTNPIRLTTGRLLVPFTYVISSDGTFGIGVLYSDNDGASWNKSASELSIPSIGGEGGVTEAAIAELADGTVKMYFRQQRSDLYTLGASTSTDHGVTWSPVADSEIMSSNTFPALIRDGQDDLLLTWSGHNALGGGSYQRNNLTVAYSEDDASTWNGYLDLMGRTRLSTPGWLSPSEQRTVVQADKIPAGDDAWLFAWSGPGGAYSMLVEDFDRYLRRTHGVMDSFEYDNPFISPDNGSRLANEHWWKTTSAGVVESSGARAKQGERSLYVADNADDKKITGASRLFPASRKASVQFSVYGESFGNDLYVSLQEGYSQHWNALGAGFILRIGQDGSLTYTDTATDSSTTEAKIGFVNPDSNPLTGNLIELGSTGSFALDYRNRSIGADLGQVTPIWQIKLLDSKAFNKPQPDGTLGNRLREEHLEVYVSNTNNGDWTRVDGWNYDKTDGNITLDLQGLSVAARFVKVHQSFSDDAFTFGGPQQEIMEVVTDANQPIAFSELPVPADIGLNEWTQIRIDYDLTEESADIYVNGDFKGVISDAHPGATINHLMFSSGAAGMGTEVYIDEVIIRDGTYPLPVVSSVGAESGAETGAGGKGKGKGNGKGKSDK